MSIPFHVVCLGDEHRDKLDLSSHTQIIVTAMADKVVADTVRRMWQSDTAYHHHRAAYGLNQPVQPFITPLT